ncbi:MAG: tRNA (adenosine(37)-N6)-threonylcarbamoyltransferase complex ATPase subunit type 1 TsaE [Nitrospirae bacterium]|nr:MAG: tRNA (adenosine(37)-N6)-threonylcarbamoyltransferase complex ATPase subunit type 1 TsaE [Nitrospirota bacterium]
MPEYTIITKGSEETEQIGEALSSVLPPGAVVCLFGDLGSGKTTLIKGIGRGLGIAPEEITSASFVIIAEHYGRLPLYHVDLYRVENPDALEETGIYEYMPSDGITVIEWAERLHDKGDCKISIKIDELDYNMREITINGTEDFIKALKESL